MLISLRSPLVAGTAAVIGAGSIAFTGAQHPLPALPTSANVALAAFHNPVEELLGTLEVGQNYLFGTYYDSLGAVNWPFAGIGDLLNDALYNEYSLGYYSFVGLLPQFTNQASPIIRQLTTNLYTYINAALDGTIAAVSELSAGVWNYPSEAINALELALNGQIGEAITVLVDAVVDPIAAAGAAVFDTVAFVVTDFLAKTIAVLEVIPQNLTLFAGAAIGGVTVLAERSVEIATAWLNALGAGDWEGAWNTAVDGLFGPSGLPGTVLNLTIGAGVQTGPIATEADIPENFVPSFRTAIQGTIWNTQEALTAVAPTAAAVASAAAVAEAPAVEPVEVAEVAEVAEVSEPAKVAEVSEPAEKAVAESADTTAPAAAAPEPVEAATGAEAEADPKPARSHRGGKRAAKAAAAG